MLMRVQWAYADKRERQAIFGLPLSGKCWAAPKT